MKPKYCPMTTHRFSKGELVADKKQVIMSKSSVLVAAKASAPVKRSETIDCMGFKILSRTQGMRRADRGLEYP